jgi:phenylacetate-CoA ligase
VSLPVIEPRPDLYDEEERWSLDQLRANQLTRLQATVRTCYEHVPHYRAQFEARGIHPDDIKDLTDIRLLPFTSKKDLRENYPFGLLAVPRKHCVRVHASSGTTGKPTVVTYTRKDIDTWANLMARCFRNHGMREGDVFQNTHGYGLFTGGIGCHYGAERLGATVVPTSGGQTERQIQLMIDFQTDVIIATPSYFLTLMDFMDSHGVDPASTNLKIAIFGSEPWTEAMRREVEDRAQIHVLNLFGLSELMGPGVASECIETKDGLTIWEDHFFPEIINPVTGEPMPDGEEGELVFTSLTKEAMPLLRYRTRDLTKLLPGTARPAHRRMERITGRSDDLMIIRGVNVFPTQIEEIILEYPALTAQYQCVLTRPKRMDELTVHVEAQPTTAPQDYEQLSADIKYQIKARIGTTAAVKVLLPGSMERSIGKARRIVDNREPQAQH